MTHTETDEPTEPTIRPISGTCPFCNAEIRRRDGEGAVYRCGSIGSHTTGHHKGDCLSPTMVQQGPL